MTFVVKTSKDEKTLGSYDQALAEIDPADAETEVFELSDCCSSLVSSWNHGRLVWSLWQEEEPRVDTPNPVTKV